MVMEFENSQDIGWIGMYALENTVVHCKCMHFLACKEAISFHDIEWMDRVGTKGPVGQLTGLKLRM